VEPRKTYTRLTTEFVDSLRSSNPNTPHCVILIGSVARGTETSQSDLDLLVLSDRDIRVPRTDPQLHVQFVREGLFREKLRAGDDFAAWCIRFGVPVISSEAWLSLANSPEATIWPEWRKKVVHAARRLLLATTMLDTEDKDAAAEETLYAASHTARAILLNARIFPLSRPEMIQQLQDGGHQPLAEILKQLIYMRVTKRELRRTQFYIKKLLVDLDRKTYRDYVTARRRVILDKLKRSSKALH
jgi:Nucleotidyltransferase domain